MARLQEFYTGTVVPQLKEKLALKNVMEVPKITKITLNMGIGEAVADRKVVEKAVGDMQQIAGQKPVNRGAHGTIPGIVSRHGGRG